MYGGTCKITIFCPTLLTHCYSPLGSTRATPRWWLLHGCTVPSLKVSRVTSHSYLPCKHPRPSVRRTTTANPRRQPTSGGIRQGQIVNQFFIPTIHAFHPVCCPSNFKRLTSQVLDLDDLFPPPWAGSSTDTTITRLTHGDANVLPLPHIPRSVSSAP